MNVDPTEAEWTELRRLAHEYHIHQVKANFAFEIYSAYRFSLTKRLYEHQESIKAKIEAIDKEYKKSQEYLNIFTDPQEQTNGITNGQSIT